MPLGIARSLALYYGRPLRLARLVRFYRALLPPGGLYFDIGAHVGHRVWAARKAGLQVLAVEPHPHCQAVLQRFFGRDRGVTLINAAVARREGTTILHFDRGNPTVSSTSQDWIGLVSRSKAFRNLNWDTQAQVPTLSLDGLIAEHGVPDYCKIDIEGSEIDALEGLSHPVPLISIERLPAASALFERCLDTLCGLAPYSFNWTRGERPEFSGVWGNRAGLSQAMKNERAVCDVFAALPTVKQK